MSNEPTDRDSETATERTFSLLLYCANCATIQRQAFPFGARVREDNTVLTDFEDRVTVAGKRVDCKACGSDRMNTRQQTEPVVEYVRTSSAEDERAVLAELLRLYDYAERTKQDDDHEGDDEAFFAEWHATYARAREVLARREKEGKDK